MTDAFWGYADYQASPGLHGFQIVSGSFVVPAGGQLDVVNNAMGNFASLRLRVIGDANGIVLQVLGAEAPGAEFLPPLYRWVVTNLTTINAVLPIPSPFVIVRLLNAGGVNSTVTVEAVPTNVQTENPHLYVNSPVFDVNAAVVNAAVQNDYYPPDHMAGPASVWMLCQAGVVDVRFSITTYDRTGTFEHRVAQWKNISANGFVDQIVLPDRIWRMEVFNNTGVAQTFYFAISSNVSAR